MSKFKNMQFHIGDDPELSKRVQEILFGLGSSWATGGQEVKDTGATYIQIWADGEITKSRYHYVGPTPFEDINIDWMRTPKPERAIVKVGDEELDLAAAKASGRKARIATDEFVLVPGGDTGGMFSGCVLDSAHSAGAPMEFSPSTNWSQCGPLIEEYSIGICYHMGFGVDPWWEASWYQDVGDKTAVYEAIGPTPQIAACRAIVSANLR